MEELEQTNLLWRLAQLDLRADIGRCAHIARD